MTRKSPLVAIAIGAFATVTACGSASTPTTGTTASALTTSDVASATDCLDAYAACEKAGTVGCRDTLAACVDTKATDAGGHGGKGKCDKNGDGGPGGGGGADVIGTASVGACLDTLVTCVNAGTDPATCVADAETCITAPAVN